jgi:hypothetical protein
MAPEDFKPQFSKLGPAIKMTLQVNSSNLFHSESIEIDNNITIQYGLVGLLCVRGFQKCQSSL